MILGMRWARGPGRTDADPEYREGLERLSRSLTLFTEGHFEHEAARSSLELGRLLKMAGHGAEGERHIQQATEVFQKLGAIGDLERALQISPQH
jgi:hypothetical protein